MAESQATIEGVCWACGQPGDRHWEPAAPGARPRKDDISICMYCGTLSIFDPPSYRRATDKELRAILEDPELVDRISALQEAARRKAQP